MLNTSRPSTGHGPGGPGSARSGATTCTRSGPGAGDGVVQKASGAARTAIGSTPGCTGRVAARVASAWRGAVAMPAIAVLAALAGCASLPAARMALPAPLAAAVPEPVAGIGYGRTGEFALGAERIRFSRGRDRLELFDVVSFDRAPVRYALTRADGSLVEASCRGRQNTITLGVLQGNAKPFSVECEWRQHPQGRVAGMNIAAPSWMPGTRAERSGSFTLGATTLEVKSVHQVQGSPLPLEAPIGYVMTHQGRPVGAIELNGSTPRLWRPAAADPLAEPVTLAALALALLWDPAEAAP